MLWVDPLYVAVAFDQAGADKEVMTPRRARQAAAGLALGDRPRQEGGGGMMGGGCVQPAVKKR